MPDYSHVGASYNHFMNNSRDAIGRHKGELFEKKMQLKYPEYKLAPFEGK